MDERTQWHPAFCAAMELELCENREGIEYRREYNLSRKPLQADLLVIKKSPEVSIKNEIGEMFRLWNIMEYKSPTDSVDIDDFYKVNAYACLFKSQGGCVNAYAASEITVTLVSWRYPATMIKTMEQEGFFVCKKRAGIFEVQGNLLFQTQIIVIEQLEGIGHVWLKSLTNRIEKSEFQKLAEQIIGLSRKDEKVCADAVLEVVTRAIAGVIEAWREDAGMSKTLEKIMEPEIKRWKAEAEKAGLKAGLKAGRAQGLEAGRAEGLEAGRAEGREVGILLAKQVIRLDAQGVELSDIAKQVGITEQDVRAILA